MSTEPGDSSTDSTEGARPRSVVTGRELQTQVAREQDVIYSPAAHYKLGEADFNRIVDPPPRHHQWLNTTRGAFLGSLIIAVAAVFSALRQSQPLEWSTVPDSAKAGLGITAVLWLGVYLWVRFRPDPQRETIDRIRRTWDRSENKGERT